jgi:L-malate glycosyltransferase
MTGRPMGEPAVMPAEGGSACQAKPRIVHCVYSGLGGHATVLLTLLSERMREEFHHFVLFFGVEDLCEDYARMCTRLDVPFAYVRKRGKLAIASHRDVLRTIGRVAPDIVMINGTPLAVPILAARAFARKQWAVVVRESQSNHQKTRLEWLGSYVASLAADAVVYLTDEYRTEVENGIRLPLRRSGSAIVIPNGIELKAFQISSGSPEGRVRLAMVSRLVPLKNHAALIEACRILHSERGHRGIELVIAGDGPLRAQLEDQGSAAGLDDVLTFTGLLGRAEVIDLLRSTDIYAHCTYGEGMSNSILQAMASSLPVVASNVRGVSNVLRHGVDGLLVPVDDPVALADTVEQLIENPELRASLAANARRRVEDELSQERVVASYRTLFYDLI